MSLILLFLITFVAATLQAATGFGFGLIAVTAFVILLQSIAAVQIVIIITLAMSIVHWFKIRSQTPNGLVKKLILGCAIGYPIGIALFSMADLYSLKIAVAAFILLISAQNGLERYRASKNMAPRYLPMNRKYCTSVGTVSGVMASALAMPGPAVIGYLTQCQLDKDAVRATVITTSTVSYAIALILQVSVVGIETETWRSAAMLLPATFAGALFGDYIAKYINPDLFKNITLLVLVASGFNILYNL